MATAHDAAPRSAPRRASEKRRLHPEPLPEHAEDRSLANRIVEGDEAAFEIFVERLVPALYRFTLTKLEGDRELTQEIVQTTLSKAIAKLDSYRGSASLLTWLCACGRNEILMHFRRQRTSPAQVELEDRTQPAAGLESTPQLGAEAELLRREESRFVHVALEALPDHYARALELKYIDRLPVKEIAALLGVAPKAAESLLTRARQKFRSSYEELIAGERMEGAARSQRRIRGENR